MPREPGSSSRPREVIVEEQAGADHPGRPQMRHVRHHEAQRPHDVRRGAQQHLALLQRLAHQGELAVLQIAQPAVDQLACWRTTCATRDRPARTSSTERPRPAASRAMPAPLMPPPTTSRSYRLPCVTCCVPFSHALSLSSEIGRTFNVRLRNLMNIYEKVKGGIWFGYERFAAASMPSGARSGYHLEKRRRGVRCADG